MLAARSPWSPSRFDARVICRRTRGFCARANFDVACADVAATVAHSGDCVCVIVGLFLCVYECMSMCRLSATVRVCLRVCVDVCIG